MAVPELHARALARKTHGDAAEGRLPPQGRAGRRALVSVHAPEPATPGSARSLLAGRARDKAGLAGAGEGASSPPASFREARESGVRPRIPAGVTESLPEAKQKGSLPLRPCSASLSHGRSVLPLHFSRSAHSPCLRRAPQVPASAGVSASPGSPSPRARRQGLSARIRRSRSARPRHTGSAVALAGPWVPAWVFGSLPGGRARGRGVARLPPVGAERGALASRRAAATIPGCALPPPLTRAAGSSPLRRRPHAAEGRGQRQQIGELAGPRSSLRREPPRPGRCAVLAPRPSASEPPAAAPRTPAAVPRRYPPVPAAPGAPPWGPGSASGCCCCLPPSCSTRSAAGPLQR